MAITRDNGNVDDKLLEKQDIWANAYETRENL